MSLTDADAALLTLLHQCHQERRAIYAARVTRRDRHGWQLVHHDRLEPLIAAGHVRVEGQAQRVTLTAAGIAHALEVVTRR